MGRHDNATAVTPHLLRGHLTRHPPTRHPEERSDEGSSYCTRQDFTGCFPITGRYHVNFHLRVDKLCAKLLNLW